MTFMHKGIYATCNIYSGVKIESNHVIRLNFVLSLFMFVNQKREAVFKENLKYARIHDSLNFQI